MSVVRETAPVAAQAMRDWLQPFGIDDFAGRAVFSYDDEIAIAVETSADASVVIITAALHALPKDAAATTLRRLLTMSHKGQMTGGGALALDATETLVMLNLAWPLAALTSQTFADLLATFLDNAVAARAAVAEAVRLGDGASPGAPRDAANAIPV